MNSSVSPEAVLLVLSGLLIDIDLLPRLLERLILQEKVDEKILHLACWGQNAGQFGFIVTGEAKAPSRDDGNAESQANVVTGAHSGGAEVRNGPVV